MAKVAYGKLNLKTNTNVNTFKFNEQEIEVLQYLPVEDKYDLIISTLQESEEDGIYNELKIDMMFHLNLIFLYTNINFTDKQKENVSKLFDSFKSSGFLDAFLTAMDPKEYEELLTLLQTQMQDILEYTNTIGSVVKTIITDMPGNAELAANIVQNFDRDKYQNLLDFAKENGNR